MLRASQILLLNDVLRQLSLAIDNFPGAVSQRPASPLRVRFVEDFPISVPTDWIPKVLDVVSQWTGVPSDDERLRTYRDAFLFAFVHPSVVSPAHRKLAMPSAVAVVGESAIQFALSSCCYQREVKMGNCSPAAMAMAAAHPRCGLANLVMFNKKVFSGAHPPEVFVPCLYSFVGAVYSHLGMEEMSQGVQSRLMPVLVDEIWPKLRLL